MCGIFALLNNRAYNAKEHTDDFIQKQFQKGRGRGPEHSVIEKPELETVFGFHRLAINGLNDQSNQPIVRNNIMLICNGEIYNYKELYELMDVVPDTGSDCEVILHLYEKYGIEQTLQLLDGVFSFILLDSRYAMHGSTLFIARDPYGVRPLYTLMLKNEKAT
jgi:asparagine synthase (glutamine-hydrolysing)